MSHEEEYVEEIRVVRRKKDTYRSNSSKSDEFESDLLRSKASKNVAGPTESRPVDEEELRQRYQNDPAWVTSDSSRRELTPGQQALADALVDLGEMAIREFFVPLIRDVAAPAAQAKWNELSGRRRIRVRERAEVKARMLKAAETTVKVAETTLEVIDEPKEAALSTELEAAEPTIPMRRSDLLLAQLHLKLAEDYVAKQRWLVMHAEVTGDDFPSALERPLTLMLEGRADELNDDEREVLDIFIQRAGRTGNGRAALPPDPPASAI